MEICSFAVRWLGNITITYEGGSKITGIIFFKWSVRFYTITTLVSFKVLSF